MKIKNTLFGKFVREHETTKKYTKKIVAPVYEPKNQKPKISEMLNIKKMKSLFREIEKSDVSNGEKSFLKYAASRLIEFDYEKIADYYSHSNKDMQDLMEKMALVIIDFNKAIENGYVKLSEELANQYKKDYSND